jgi:N-acetylmuramoyl-L-alanine amidase
VFSNNTEGGFRGLCYLTIMTRLLSFFCIIYCLQASAHPFQTEFLYGRTAGPLPYLKYGLGNDRLGGAKMTFLDTNIVVKVVDSIKDDYKVQLSKYHFAYLPKGNFESDSSIKIQPYYLTNSWKVYGDDKYDYVTVLLDERLPYRSIQQINPGRIAIDIFGVVSNTNWITQLTSAKEIKNAYYEQTGEDVFRVIIELKHQQHWGYSIYYEGQKITIKVNRQPAVLSLKKLKVAVDAGHGGENTGAGGISGIAEKDYTLKIAKELEKALKKEKATVFMTRKKDTTLSMTERILMLRQQAPDLLISIHLNSAGRDSIQGASTYYRYTGFRPLTQTILKRMMELGLKEYGNVGSFNFALSGPTDYPNCLVEVAFLSNKEDERRILNPKFHKKVATKIVAGIKDWLKNMR